MEHGRFRLFHAVLPAHVEQEYVALDRLLALMTQVGDEAALAKEVCLHKAVFAINGWFVTRPVVGCAYSEDKDDPVCNGVVLSTAKGMNRVKRD